MNGQETYTESSKITCWIRWEVHLSLSLSPYGRFTHRTGSPWPVHFKHCHGWKGGAAPSSLHTTLEGPTESSTTFKNHLLEVGLTKNWETMALWTLTTVDALILFYHVWGSAWIEIRWHSIRLRSRSHTTSHYTWGPATTLHDVGGVLGWDGLWTLPFFWALTISWSRLLARVW